MKPLRATQTSAALTGLVLGLIAAGYEKLSELPSFKASAWGDTAGILALVFAVALLYLFVIGIQAPFERTWFLDNEESKRNHETTKRMVVGFLAAGVSLLMAQPLLWLAGLLIG